MRLLFVILLFSPIKIEAARADGVDTTFSNFGGTTNQPNTNNSMQSNSLLNATGNSTTGFGGLSTGSNTLNAGGAASSVPQTGFNGTGGPTLNTGGLPTSVPLGSGGGALGGGVPNSAP